MPCMQGLHWNWKPCRTPPHSVLIPQIFADPERDQSLLVEIVVRARRDPREIPCTRTAASHCTGAHARPTRARPLLPAHAASICAAALSPERRPPSTAPGLRAGVSGRDFRRGGGPVLLPGPGRARRCAFLQPGGRAPSERHGAAAAASGPPRLAGGGATGPEEGRRRCPSPRSPGEGRPRPARETLRQGPCCLPDFGPGPVFCLPRTGVHAIQSPGLPIPPRPASGATNPPRRCCWPM